MKKLLITGSNGFIGSFLVEQSLKSGFDVFAAVRPGSSTKFLKNQGVNIISFEIYDKEIVKKYLLDYQKIYGKFDYIIHNAGITKTSNIEQFNRVNYQFTVNLIQALIETSSIPDKFIFMSSLAALGPGDDETMLPIRDNDPANPVSAYGKSKRKAEEFIMNQKNFPYLILRPTGVYGPREKDYLMVYKLINRHLETYIGTDKQKLSFIYVKDLAKLVINSLENKYLNKAYVVADGDEYTAAEFSMIVKTLLNKKTIKIIVPTFIAKPISFIAGNISSFFGKISTLNAEKYLEISQPNWLVNVEGIKKDLGFKPEYNLFRGVKETLKWNKKNNLI